MFKSEISSNLSQ